MDVTNHSNWRSYVYNVALLHKKLLRFGAYCLDHRLSQQLLLRQPRYALIEVHGSCAWLARARSLRPQVTYMEDLAW